jgi:hypothetical protein
MLGAFCFSAIKVGSEFILFISDWPFLFLHQCWQSCQRPLQALIRLSNGSYRPSSVPVHAYLLICGNRSMRNLAIGKNQILAAGAICKSRAL